MTSRQRYRTLLMVLLLPLLLATPPHPLAATAQSTPLPIYADALGTGWQNWSWASVDLQATTPVHSGSRSIRVTYGAWQGLYLHHPGIDTTGFSAVRFYIHGGTAGGQRLQLYAVRASDPGGAHGPQIALPLPVASGWTEVQVSLADLQAENTQLTGLVWQDRSGGAQPSLFIDDIALVSNASPDAPTASEGSLRPAAAPADGTTQVVARVRVTDPQGAGDIASVTLNASALGRGSVVLRDDGLSNDGAAGDGLFGARFTIAPGTASGEHTLLVTAEDGAGHRATLSLGALAILAPPGGTIPAVLPQRLAWGTNAWSETAGQDWQVNSGVPWDYVYQYITYDWYVNGWGGNFVGRFVAQAWNKNYIPVISVYLMLDAPPNCGESGSCYAQKLQSAQTVTAYLNALQEAARQARGSRPVIFQLEPDFYGYMQQLSNQAGRPPGVRPDDPSSYPVALNTAGYPNTLAGFGQRMVDIVHSTAPNVLVAPHASAWATDGDPNNGTPADTISIAQRTAAFMNAMGGAQADLFFVEWSDRDAGSGLRPWWDDTNRTLPRPTRAILWENALSAAANKRLILWQIPVGNMALDNSCNRYRDNRVAYISRHPRDLVDAGVVGLLFGGGATCMTQPPTDGGFLAAQGATAYALPAAPTGLSSSSGTGGATLRWNENSEPDIWGYEAVYQPSGGGSSTTLDVRRANSTTLALGAGSWEVRVAAYDAMGRRGALSAPLTISGGCYDIAPPGGVGVEDVQAVAARWPQPEAAPYDNDGDGLVTITDIMRVAAAWGSSCP